MVRDALNHIFLCACLNEFSKTSSCYLGNRKQCSYFSVPSSSSDHKESLLVCLSTRPAPTASQPNLPGAKVLEGSLLHTWPFPPLGGLPGAPAEILGCDSTPVAPTPAGLMRKRDPWGKCPVLPHHVLGLSFSPSLWPWLTMSTPKSRADGTGASLE